MQLLQSPHLWKKLLRESFTNWEKLADFLLLSEEDRKQILVHHKFPLLLPYRLASKIEKGRLDDPLLKQFLPQLAETAGREGYSPDPVGDLASQKAPKLIHKYQGRVLLVTTSACAMHCRYCFRKEYPYEVEEKGYFSEIEYIENDPTLSEVIFSGGDPLSLSDIVLKGLVHGIGGIPHIKHLRFHSRFLIGIPERVTDSFLEIFEGLSQQKWFVLHCNHPREVDGEVASALAKLRRAGFHLLNQSVLLQGVNDSADTLTALSETLIDHGVIPYYLHQLDRVRGSHHFEVPKDKGRELLREVRSRLPGYAVPEFVEEIAGQPNKNPL